MYSFSLHLNFIRIRRVRTTMKVRLSLVCLFTVLCLATFAHGSSCPKAPRHLNPGRRTRGDNGYKLVIGDNPSGYIPGKTYNSECFLINSMYFRAVIAEPQMTSESAQIRQTFMLPLCFYIFCSVLFYVATKIEKFWHSRVMDWKQIGMWEHFATYCLLVPRIFYRFYEHKKC